MTFTAEVEAEDAAEAAAQLQELIIYDEEQGAYLVSGVMQWLHAADKVEAI